MTFEHLERLHTEWQLARERAWEAVLTAPDDLKAWWQRVHEMKAAQGAFVDAYFELNARL